MTNQVEWTTKATRQLLQIDRRYIAAIREKVAKLTEFPQVHLDIKHLENNQYRLRHGDYRVFFEVIDGTPKIINIQKIQRRNNRTYK
ncbi:type II toxin-antitoxin system RelE/ParE family toxin [Conchiformibius steedae]|uniref:type II toxin-antitoxin system RelE family toxin n=1 Tax=Conchiformibius steedae TaxID=153493 RepID=UPI0026F25768|nr:type II toxin-antitoxin system RelE/ParE family toxin [Conchiformibius steedae]